MTKPFIQCPNFDLDLVFKVIMIIESFFCLELLIVKQSVIFGFGRFFIMIEDSYIEELSNIHQPDQFDLCQGHGYNF